MSIISSIDKSEIFSAFCASLNVKTHALFYCCCNLLVSSLILFPKFLVIFCDFFLFFFVGFFLPNNKLNGLTTNECRKVTRQVDG